MADHPTPGVGQTGDSMYIKVTAGNHPYGQHGNFLTEVAPPIYSAVTSAPIGDGAEWGDDGKLTHPGSIDFNTALGATISYIHVLEFDVDQTEYEKNNDMVAFRYAWWHSDRGVEAVVTTRRMFVLGANGKTIDRI